MRRNAQSNAWHPSTDNATGTDVYGTFSNDPIGPETFSIKYDNLAWTKIAFRTGDETEYVFVDRTVLQNLITNAKDGNVANDCESCEVPLLGSSCEGVTPAPTQMMRIVAPEDPWFGCGVHPERLVYGENSHAGHT